jgi:very-short-patch-repair endonuclease
MPVKKGDFVRLVREKFEQSLEAKASDRRLSSYVFTTQGEILETRDDYALVKFGRVPTPNMWLKLEQLEKFE